MIEAHGGRILSEDAAASSDENAIAAEFTNRLIVCTILFTFIGSNLNVQCFRKKAMKKTELKVKENVNIPSDSQVHV